MDQKTNLNRNNSYNFFSEHTTGILRKSLAHIRKPEDQHTFRRNNSLSRAINQNFSKPSIIAPMMIESTQAINRKPLPLHNEIDNSKMFTSAFSSNLTHKNIKIKLRKPSSITYLVQKNQPIDKNSPNTHHNPIIKTKGMIKIRSSERLKTPTKEERNSWNSKKNKDSPKNSFKNNINTQKPPSFFSIKSKPQTKIISRFSLDNTNIHDLELSEADSLIIEPEELEKTMKSLEKTQTILPKITKDSQIKINEKFNSIVDKAAKDNKKKRFDISPILKI